MDIPNDLKDALDSVCKSENQSEIIKNSKDISSKYRNSEKSGKRLVSSSAEVDAYCISRMPATYCAVYSALKYCFDIFRKPLLSVLDVGAGTGAASWTASSFLPSAKITCLEREPAMAKKGRELMANASEPLKNAEWIIGDISSDFNLSADCVTASYVLNELAPQQFESAVNRLWNSANEFLLIVEPGTPAGYSNIITARNILLQNGAHIVAPCTHSKPCPLCKDDWCAFSCRVSRSRLHRLAKGGDAPFEDEKFSFLAVCRSKQILPSCRILRHPQISSGFVKINVCNCDAHYNTLTVTKKYGNLYKFCRKASACDSFSV